ncbi:calcium uniporter protein 4 mitochondrial [Prunus yedoensis var. nudiflora]|uniref:Calcium uniporter protein 4 mitochondrial n=1 Tax=Prunus yedoensis var. nudiflora TaxID=2094558 RepID=A0A314Z3J7_PRUYE|nr:calcium uniporter protein 4 mitochondrial [Prunus yedoensis var. nudiflora]
MALRKALAKRQFDAIRVTLASSSVVLKHQTIVPPNAARANFHREYLTATSSAALNQSAPKLPKFLTIPVGEKLREKLRGINISSDRLWLAGLSPPSPDLATPNDALYGISVSDAKKILRLSQVEKLKAKLREIPESSISYSEFVRICVEGYKDEEQGAEFSKMLDESGNVIVLGNVVFLRPEQVAKSMESIISQSMAMPNNPRRRELQQLETQKMVIDQKAWALVRGELYCGLGFLLFQTISAIRMTFWELSWDVMEPICFIVASMYFALGYGFFLRTSTEPTFQGFFQRRFEAKQQRLMEAHKFDVQKYKQLPKVFYPNSDHSALFSS